MDMYHEFSLKIFFAGFTYEMNDQRKVKKVENQLQNANKIGERIIIYKFK